MPRLSGITGQLLIVSLLLQCGCQPEMNSLVETLDSPDSLERIAAIKQIEDRIESQQADELDATPLAEALTDNDATVRYRAAKCLAKLEDRATPAMAELAAAMLDQQNEDRIRYYAAKALCKIGDESQDVMPQLIQALDDPSEDVVCYAMRTLGKIGSPARQAVPRLRQLKRSNSAAIQQVAEEALGMIDQGQRQVAAN
ncbi:MAG: HEAT repeat domain-containing protein [Pirellulaceae bacterium]